ncbi:MAG: serine hydrolase [Phycisphaerales bacterium]
MPAIRFNFALQTLQPIVAAATLSLLPGSLALAQADVPVATVDDGDGSTTTRITQPPNRISWGDFDTVVDPTRPELGSSDLVAEVVAHEFLELMSSGNYQQARERALVLTALAPDRPAGHYNLACAHAQCGDLDEAFASLDAAINLGWRETAHMSIDPDIDPLRRDPRFAAVVEDIRSRVHAEAVVPAPLRETPWQEIVAEMQERMPALLDRYHVPGISIALIRDGNVVFTGAYGVVDVRQPETAMTSHTLFLAAAPADLLTAMAAVQLSEKTIWSLDDPVSRWLHQSPLTESSGADVTIRSALNHSAGLRYQPISDIYQTIDDDIRFSFTRDRARADAGRSTWCPQAYRLIGRAIELAVSPASSDDSTATDPQTLDGYLTTLIRGSILRPLGMHHTLPRYPSGSRYTVATGHTEYGTPYRMDVIEPRRPSQPMFATAADLGKLVAFFAGRGENERAPISPGGIIAIETPADAEGSSSRSFGLGVMVLQPTAGFEANGPCIELGNVERGCGSLLRWYPESGDGIVILYNSATGEPLARQLAHLALGGM